ncbi:xanthine dehydrogenase YagR molybdenum-binding subunit [Flavobacteriaceae bacterium MAR_2009_75]|nr:xanthine dehydrogenase YagR molybdenum-binding subunit [Flavobacteriaceae bacterium MAR_2009_75]
MKTNNASGVGNAINRVESHLKVTGLATYASEFKVDKKVYGQGINSTIAKGEIIGINTSKAEKLKGVLKIITYKNAEKLKGFDKERPVLATDSIAPVLQSNKVHYYGEYVGFVVAETFEQAQYAASLVKFKYKEDDSAHFILEQNKEKAYKPSEESDHQRGNLKKGFSEADAIIEQTYNTPIEHQHPMELHATIANWNNGKVLVYASQQIVDDAVIAISGTFLIPKKDVRVVAKYVGGGFGSKLNVERHLIMAVMASKMVGRPVQATVTRSQMFTNTGLRQSNIQVVKLGAKKSGQLTALSHEILSYTSTTQEFQEPCGSMSKMMYNVANATVSERLVPMNLQQPFSMRAPGEATGSFALECAIDELAWKLKMDPLAFRIENDTQEDLSKERPFSSRLLVECLTIGADEFGWKKRNQAPRTNKKGNWLIGYGVSAAAREAPFNETHAKILLDMEGDTVTATLQMDATDIGTGSYTILAQTVSECLNISLNQVVVELGDSDYPITPGSGGSWGAASYCNGAKSACDNAIRTLKKNRNIAKDEDITLAELLKMNQLTSFESEGLAKPDSEFEKHSVFSFGANFTEVWVDKDTGMYKIKRMVNVGSAGKILNPKTAYGQVIGGLTMGAGMVIAEQTRIEPNFGNFITRSFADYHVPVNLDMANVDVIFLPEEDKVANKMGIKGIGELGITSVAASIANAIFNATGKRIRDLPITPEKLLMAEVEDGVKH